MEVGVRQFSGGDTEEESDGEGGGEDAGAGGGEEVEFELGVFRRGAGRGHRGDALDAAVELGDLELEKGDLIEGVFGFGEAPEEDEQGENDPGHPCEANGFFGGELGGVVIGGRGRGGEGDGILGAPAAEQ